MGHPVSDDKGMLDSEPFEEDTGGTDDILQIQLQGNTEIGNHKYVHFKKKIKLFFKINIQYENINSASLMIIFF